MHKNIAQEVFLRWVLGFSHFKKKTFHSIARIHIKGLPLLGMAEPMRAKGKR
jgi:hypothetical protein